MYDGRTVFAQLMDFLPRRAFDNAVRRYRGDRKTTKLSCRDQLACMLFAQFSMRSSLRDTVLCLNSLGSGLYHCGVRGEVSKSTLADANSNRDFRIFMDTALSMAHRDAGEKCQDEQIRKLIAARVFALDSTTIDLCLKLFPWALFRRHKAGIKLHTLYDVGLRLPVFIHITAAREHDVNAMDVLPIEAGAFYVVDKAYVDFARLRRIHLAPAFFVTRCKKNMQARIVSRNPAMSDQGILSDCLVRLRGKQSRSRYPDTLRVIRYKDPETGRKLKFLTNCQTLGPTLIALLYKKRWQIELFFKWVKQHLSIKAFYGNTLNAVAVQVWVAVIAFLLIRRLKAQLELTQSPGEIFQVLSVSLMQKTSINQVFERKNVPISHDDPHNQLMLFKI